MLTELLTTFAGNCWALGVPPPTFWVLASFSLASMLEVYLVSITRRHEHEHTCAHLSSHPTKLTPKLSNRKSHTPRICDIPECTSSLRRAARLRSQQLAGSKWAEREAIQQERSQRTRYQDPRQRHTLPKRVIRLSERAIRQDLNRVMIVVKVVVAVWQVPVKSVVLAKSDETFWLSTQSSDVMSFWK